MPIENIPLCPTVTIDESGITAPLFVDKHAWLRTVFQEIYGTDIYIENDSQDGQLIGIIAKAMFDADSAVVAAYNAFSPSTAQGAGLTRVTKINGIRRKVATRSSVDLRIIGLAGTVITKGYAIDLLSQRWLLPDEVVIPESSEIIVTALAVEPGALFAPPNTVNRIGTITRGWQSVDNPEASTIGNPVETDEMLRVRQSISTSIPSKSTFESLVGAVASIEGTNRYRGYENDTTGPDEYGLPANSISIVVEGGDTQEIATIIYKKKAPGTITNGTTFENYIDEAGIAHRVYFSRPVQVPIQVVVPIKPRAKYTVNKDLAIRSAVSNWVNNNPIGELVSVEEIGGIARLSTPQYPEGDPTFYVKPPILIGLQTEVAEEEDLIMAFDQRSTCTAQDVIIQIVP